MKKAIRSISYVVFLLAGLNTSNVLATAFGPEEQREYGERQCNQQEDRCNSIREYLINPDPDELISYGNPLELKFDYSNLDAKQITQSWLEIWAKDDAKISDGSSGGKDGTEYADIFKVNDTLFTDSQIIWSKEIDESKRYLNIDVTKYVSTSGELLSAWLGAANAGSKDFLFEYAKLTFTYCSNHVSPEAPQAVTAPATVWILGSGLLGLIGSRKRLA